MLSSPAVRMIALLVPALVMAGCGNAQNTASKAADEKHVITSATDCHESTGLDYEACAGLIEKAVVQHSRSSTKYSNLAACEKAEGKERCERLDEQTYRPRMIAYLLTVGTPNTIEPLYAIQKNEAGFRDTSKKALKTDAENIKFSRSAMDAAELFVSSKKGGRS